MTELLVEKARAKINLTLRVLGRREDGYHELESLVAFTDLADTLSLAPGANTSLDISGPFAAACGPVADNLVLKAYAKLGERVGSLKGGRFRLEKKLPVAAGIGGGSSDAAAALRLLAEINDIARDDPRLASAALAIGADVPVCLDPRTRIMRGVGDLLSEPLAMPAMPAVLVNPGVPLPTRDVFAAFAGREGSKVQVGMPPARARSRVRFPRPLRQRSDATRHCLRAGHYRGVDGVASLAGRTACAHVGIGVDLFCLVSVAWAKRARPRAGCRPRTRTGGSPQR